ncbi:UNVERIFIED_CONTAM: hypothetical protein PYX00_001941 [Menopon gallinae]|uniref:Gustatory receptor n=1 Tax=Menopon gallinae TaxID=328185 RepID=A0AAW2IEM7_9NEOP
MLLPARRYLTDDELKLCDLRETDEVRKFHDPTIRVFQYLGLMVMIKRDNGTLDFQWFSFHFFYCLLCLATHYYFIYIAGVERLRMINEKSDRTFDEYIFLYSLYMFYLFEGLALAFIVESRKMVDHYNLLSAFQARYYHAKGALFYFKLRDYSRYTFIVIGGILVFILFSANVINVRPVYRVLDDREVRIMIENLISCVFLIIEVVGLHLLFVTHLLTLHCIASVFIIDMIDAFRNADDDLVSDYEKLWFDLLYLIKHFGDSFTYSVGYYLVLSILSVTFELYLAIKEEYLVVIVFGAGTLLSVTALLFYIDKLTFKVSRKMAAAVEEFVRSGLLQVTEELAEELLQIRNHSSRERRQRINRFIKVMRASGGSISFGGFVTVNNGLASSVLSNITTYIIILLQFKRSKEPVQ